VLRVRNILAHRIERGVWAVVAMVTMDDLVRRFSKPWGVREIRRLSLKLAWEIFMTFLLN